MWYATMTGQPVVVVIMPGEAPQYQIKHSNTAPFIKSDSNEVPGCKTTICKV